MSKLRRYNDADCDYSLFISYAHLDDLSEDDWVRALKDAIYQRFGQLPKNIPRKQIHFSGDSGAGGGTLGSELEDRVRRSFAMLLVVGKHYIDSEWCEKELALFARLFPGGTTARLYIAVMGEDYLTRAEQGKLWQSIVAPDQLWTKMFREQYTNRPLEHRLLDGARGFPPAFRDAACLIADRLIKEIEGDWAASEASANVPTTSPSDASRAPLMPTSKSNTVLTVAVGPYTESFDPCGTRQPVALLQQTLEKAGAEVFVVDRNLLMSYDPEDGTPLRPKLDLADVLLVPVLDEKPLRPDVEGGHTTILTSEWAALKKPPKSLVWYRPPPADVPPGEVAKASHLDKFKQLAPVCTSPQAVVNLLFGAGTSDVIRVYIENHPVVPMYGLINALESAWTSLRTSAGERRPNLKCVPLRLDQLDDVPKDVAAIVLLDAKGFTPKKSLRDRETEVEKCFPKSYPCYPGLVALVFTPPPPDSMPNHEWGDVTFYRSDTDPPELNLDKSSRIWLHEFLNQMWQQYQEASTAAMP